MTATAAKPGYGTGSWYANHGDFRLAQSGYAHGYHGHEAVKVPVKAPTGRWLKQIPEPPLTNDEQRRAGYLRAQKMLQASDRVVVVKAVIRGKSSQLIGASAPIEQPNPSAPLEATIAHKTKQIPSATAFTIHLEHLNFLKRVSTGERPPITPGTALLASQAWHLIWRASNYKMPAPAACTGPDGKLFYSCDHGRHHLELEIIPGQDAAFFYRDRETGHLWGEDYRIGDPLPTEAVAILRFFK